MRQRIALILLCLLLAGCGSQAAEEPARRTVFAMDTVMNLAAYGDRAEDALDAAEAELHRLDALLARGDENSAVYALNHGTATPDPELSGLVDEACEVAAATDGAFDPYLGAVLDLWGFGSGAGEHRVPAQEELAAAPPLLDLGGIAKGLAGEYVRDVFEAYHVTGAVADLGGDVALCGSKPGRAPWRVAVRDPADGSAYLGVLETAGGVYAATSGVYERYFEQDGARYHHIIDPRTGRPADSGVVSATVVCESGVWADALATACCVLGADGALALRARLADTAAFDLILVTEDGRVLCACEGFTGETGNGYTYETIT